ncbi:MAG TPA: hypothetical protein VF228_18930 [Iamia sp.]
MAWVDLVGLALIVILLVRMPIDGLPGDGNGWDQRLIVALVALVPFAIQAGRVHAERERVFHAGLLVVATARLCSRSAVDRIRQTSEERQERPEFENAQLMVDDAKAVLRDLDLRDDALIKWRDRVEMAALTLPIGIVAADTTSFFWAVYLERRICDARLAPQDRLWSAEDEVELDRLRQETEELFEEVDAAIEGVLSELRPPRAPVVADSRLARLGSATAWLTGTGSSLGEGDRPNFAEEASKAVARRSRGTEVNPS